MCREELILKGIIEGNDTKLNEIVTLADDMDLVIDCYGRTMDTEELIKEVPEDDILTYFLYEEEGYIRISTVSQLLAEQVIEELTIEGEM